MRWLWASTLFVLVASCAEGLPGLPSESEDSPDGSLDGSLLPPMTDAGEMDTGAPTPMEAGPADAGMDAAMVDQCADGEKNGLESDTDCGGPKCDKCSGGDSCVANTDCKSGMCDMTSTCTMETPDGGMGTNACMGLTAPEPTCMCFSHNSKAYFFCSGSKNWAAAKTACGATLKLVAIQDMAEQMFLAMHVTTTSWIGAANTGTTSWRWDATGVEFWNMMAVGGAYANWQAGYPLAVAGYCATMQAATFQWGATLCTLVSTGYICEQP